MKPPARTVCLAFCHPGTTSSYFTLSLAALTRYDADHGRRVRGLIQEHSSANVSAARNNTVTDFLDNYTADYLMLVDADMCFEADAVERLLTVAAQAPSPIGCFGGLCFGAQGDTLFPTIYEVHEIDGQVVTVRVPDYARDSVIQVAATGAAFLMVHRKVLEDVRDRGFDKAFPWFMETSMAGRPCGEDVTFCLRAGIAGHPVWVDTSLKIGHHKSTLLTEDKWLAQQPAQVCD